MLVLTPHITIGNLEFDFVAEVKIESSWKRLTDIATVVIPRNLAIKNEGIKNHIKVGDAVTIKLGYDSELNIEFVGYVTRIKADLPIVIECEDSMWLLKQKTVSGSWRNVSLPVMMAAILPEYTVDAVNAGLGQFRVNQETVAKLLQRLRSVYGLVSWFRNDVLNVGFAYTGQSSNYSFSFQQNIINNNLEYREADERKVKVKAVSISPNNQKEVIELGDSDGELRTLHFYNLSKAELKAQAEAKIEALKVDGYTGYFQTFGSPFVQHGDIVTISDSDYPDRIGSYLVEKVVTRFGVNGFRRSIYLGSKS